MRGTFDRPGFADRAQALTHIARAHASSADEAGRADRRERGAARQQEP